MLSVLHLETIEILKNNFPFLRIITEHKVPNSNLRFDIFLPDISLAIEIQGIQHYEMNSFFYADSSKFLESNLRDRDKKSLALKFGVEVFYLKYDEKNYLSLILKKIEDSIRNMEDEDIIISFDNTAYSSSEIERLCCPICKNRFQWKNEVDNVLGEIKYDDCCGRRFILFKKKPNSKKYRAIWMKAKR